MSREAPFLAVVVLAGAAAFYLVLNSQRTAAAAKTQSAAANKPAGSIGDALSGAGSQIIGGLGQGLSNVFAAAGQGIGEGLGQLASAELPQIADPSSDIRGGLRKFGENLTTAAIPFGLGALGDNISLFKTGEQKSRERRRAKNDRRAFADGMLANMEEFAKRAHSILSRPDVESWTLSGAGIFTVYFQGQAQPYTFSPPPAASGDSTGGVGNRLAWAAEPIVRSLGYFVQAGGRIASNFPLHEPPFGFDPRNPFAGPDVYAGPTDYQVRMTAQAAPEVQIDRAARLGTKIRDNKSALDALLGNTKET